MGTKPVDLNKLRSINYGGRMAGQSRVRPLTDDASGRRTGFEIDHSDGSVEAVVRPQPIIVTESLTTGEVVVR